MVQGSSLCDRRILICSHEYGENFPQVQFGWFQFSYVCRPDYFIDYISRYCLRLSRPNSRMQLIQTYLFCLSGVSVGRLVDLRFVVYWAHWLVVKTVLRRPAGRQIDFHARNCWWMISRCVWGGRDWCEWWLDAVACWTIVRVQEDWVNKSPLDWGVNKDHGVKGACIRRGTSSRIKRAWEVMQASNQCWAIYSRTKCIRRMERFALHIYCWDLSSRSIFQLKSKIHNDQRE